MELLYKDALQNSIFEVSSLGQAPPESMESMESISVSLSLSIYLYLYLYLYLYRKISFKDFGHAVNGIQKFDVWRLSRRTT